MRFVLLFIIAITSSLSSKEQTNYSKSFFKPDGYFEIQGKIKNYVLRKENQFITFRTFDIQGRHKDTVILLNSNGAFNLLLFQPYAGDIQMSYSDTWLSLYIPAEKKIKLEINDSTWNSDQSKSGSINMPGQAGIVTKLIWDFKNAFIKEVFKTTVNWEDSTINDEAAATIRVQRMKEELSFVKNYIAKNKITNANFINWVKNEIVYQAGFDIGFTSFTSSRKKTLTDQQLMKILKDVPVNNPSASHNSSYYRFLSLLAGDLSIIVNINPIYKDASKPYGMNPVPVYLKKVDAYSTGMAKELMYYHVYFSNSRKKTDYYQDRFRSVIKESFLKKQFIANKEKLLNPFQPFDLVERLRQYKVDDSIKARLINIFNAERENNVFIDFWGDWCIPCMKEMPYYPRFIDQFSESQASFLFFAVGTDEKSALEIKNRYGINGKFIVLNAIETNIMRNVLQFSGYPSHFVLQRASLVVDDNISRITSGGKELDKNVVDKVRKHFASSKNHF